MGASTSVASVSGVSISRTIFHRLANTFLWPSIALSAPSGATKLSDIGLVDFRALLLAFVWPLLEGGVPSLLQLLDMRRRYQLLDMRDTGRLARTQAASVVLWFEETASTVSLNLGVDAACLLKNAILGTTYRNLRICLIFAMFFLSYIAACCHVFVFPPSDLFTVNGMVCYTLLLSYLCVDDTFHCGLEKAFAVAAEEPSDEIDVDRDQGRPSIAHAPNILYLLLYSAVFDRHVF